MTERVTYFYPVKTTPEAVELAKAAARAAGHVVVTVARVVYVERPTGWSVELVVRPPA